MTNAFEQGPIRPPAEASSLLVRTTRGCPWNKCEQLESILNAASENLEALYHDSRSRII